jgi:hypothetical protein
MGAGYAAVTVAVGGLEQVEMTVANSQPLEAAKPRQARILLRIGALKS